MKLARALASRPIRALTGVNICWLDLLPPATQEKLISHTRVLANMYELGISSDRGWMFCNTHVCTVFYKNFDRLVDHWKRKKCINGFRTQSLPLASVKLGKTYSWNVKAIIAFATKTTGWTECIERMARKLNSLFVI